MNLPRYDGTSALFIAAQSGHLAVVEALLARGAEKDGRKPDGATPLSALRSAKALRDEAS